MDEELDEREDGEELGSWRFQPVVIVMRIIQLIGNIMNAYRLFCAGMCEDIAAHINYKIQRDEFASEAGKELEKLLKGDGNG